MASKLPEVGTTIFTIMSRRARELDALNLGQGFPDYAIDPRLTELVAAAMTAGHNQYAPMEGLLALRERIAAKLLSVYGLSADPESEITITLGATEAIWLQGSRAPPTPAYRSGSGPSNSVNECPQRSRSRF